MELSNPILIPSSDATRAWLPIANTDPTPATIITNNKLAGIIDCKKLLDQEDRSKGRQPGEMDEDDAIGPDRKAFLYPDWTEELPELDSKSITMDVCKRIHNFGLLDQERLFGIPDPDDFFAWQPRSGEGIISKWIYNAFYTNVISTSDTFASPHLKTPYLRLMVYAIYRTCSTVIWVSFAMLISGYFVVFALAPLLVLPSGKNVSRSSVLKDISSLLWCILLVIFTIWVLLIDPSLGAVYPVGQKCLTDNIHAALGPGVFRTSANFPEIKEWQIGIFAPIIGLLVAINFCMQATGETATSSQTPLNGNRLLFLLFLFFLFLLAQVYVVSGDADDLFETIKNTNQTYARKKAVKTFVNSIDLTVWITALLSFSLGIATQLSYMKQALNEWISLKLLFALVAIGPSLAAWIWCLVIIPPPNDKEVQRNTFSVWALWLRFTSSIVIFLYMLALLFDQLVRRNDIATAATSQPEESRHILTIDKSAITTRKPIFTNIRG